MTPAERTVLSALVRLHQREGRATVTGTATEARVPRSATYAALRSLRETGLVSMGACGGLRPVGVVLIGGELYQATRLTCGNDGEHEFDEGRMGPENEAVRACVNTPDPATPERTGDDEDER